MLVVFIFFLFNSSSISSNFMLGLLRPFCRILSGAHSLLSSARGYSREYSFLLCLLRSMSSSMFHSRHTCRAFFGYLVGTPCVCCLREIVSRMFLNYSRPHAKFRLFAEIVSCASPSISPHSMRHFCPFSMQNRDILQNLPKIFVHVVFFSYLCSRKGFCKTYT